MNPKPTYIIPNPLEDFVDYRLQSESTEHVALAMDMLLIDRVLQDFVGVLGIEAIHLTERSINQVEVTLRDLGVFQQKATNEIHRWMSDDLTIGYITRTDPTPRQYLAQMERNINLNLTASTLTVFLCLFLWREGCDFSLQLDYDIYLKKLKTQSGNPKTTNHMTSQAINCLQLYRGGNPSTIKQCLKLQKPSVLNELKNHFSVSDLDRLALCLSMGSSKPIK